MRDFLIELWPRVREAALLVAILMGLMGFTIVNCGLIMIVLMDGLSVSWAVAFMFSFSMLSIFCALFHWVLTR